jgi:two-component system, OmpR family, sensor histidine kinase BaeS
VTSAQVPWHRSLFVRLFGIGALIALVAVAAATWATVRATTVAVEQEQQESLHADAQVYDALVGYAASHRSWTEAGPLVTRLAAESSRRISITDVTGRTLVDSAGETAPRSPTEARARVDPLDVDTVLLSTAHAPTGDPDPGRCGLGETMPAECLRREVAPTVTVDGRVAGPGRGDGSGAIDAALRGDIDTCLRQAGLGPVLQIRKGPVVVVGYETGHETVARCLDEALRAVLSPRVAPPALLYVSGDGSTAEVFWDFSAGSQLRIAILAGAVLLVTLLLCAVLATTIVRPLRRMAAAALMAADGELGVRVPERRADEVGEVARAFNQMADRRQLLEEARRHLVGDVSHELRTPLANVRGWVEAAQDGVVETDQRLLASLHEETMHLQRLVDDLHDLALGDVGELRLEPETIELSVFLDQVADSFGGAARAAGITLTAEADPGASVEADPVRLRQSVANLVANALRHTPRGGRVTLQGRPGSVEVTDTGQGIAADELPQVFDRFRRVDPSRSRSTGGSGLGLAIVRQIVEAHGGTATIRSTPGVGTAVTLRLPSS